MVTGVTDVVAVVVAGVTAVVLAGGSLFPPSMRNMKGIGRPP